MPSSLCEHCFNRMFVVISIVGFGAFSHHLPVVQPELRLPEIASIACLDVYVQGNPGDGDTAPCLIKLILLIHRRMAFSDCGLETWVVCVDAALQNIDPCGVRFGEGMFSVGIPMSRLSGGTLMTVVRVRPNLTSRRLSKSPVWVIFTSTL